VHLSKSEEKRYNKPGDKKKIRHKKLKANLQTKRQKNKFKREKER